MSDTSAAELVEQVRSRYAEAARSVLNLQASSDCGCGSSCCGTTAEAAEADGGHGGHLRMLRYLVMLRRPVRRCS